ncbi:hypothetical protein LPB03_12135 [Polaribacter vadi]|uniref:Uncharacterized protein n=1 Tax=Polaribacter vadi TaxID=1774273 RepID=A0A1B8TTX1_9FLAO|nr:VCBS repeat-containing protein [Polaribacter vadi]AOW18156.1 hypothetical protein LPB03_12135 [Polaribacter vadi]OBY62885.1 hypothetical protein LPB3_12150 [Polaribacter vadi]
MKKAILTVNLLLFIISQQTHAQSIIKNKNKITLGPNDFPELINANIPGAPKLGKPQLIMSDSLPVMSEGHGWAAPAVYDWNGDGKKDLLIGEFGSGVEIKRHFGHGIRIYLNVGTNETPQYNDFHYAKGAYSEDINDYTSGALLSIHTFCCLAFTPRFADLNGDGYEDLLSGQYTPGYITWFRGSEYGFLPGLKLEEIYNSNSVNRTLPSVFSLPSDNPESMNYWMYSSAAFGDFDDDGDQDMIVGGSAIRFSENIGTKFKPLFGKREILLDVNGDPLKIKEISKEELTKAYNPVYKDQFGYMLPPPSGSKSTVPYVVDWDGDGVLDILVTSPFMNEGAVAITFFRGLNFPKRMTNEKKELRFEPGIPLFWAKNKEKEFPGTWINVCVADWNNDGVNDLLIGTNVPTLNGIFNHELAWQWEADTGIYKINPAYYSDKEKKKIAKHIKNAEEFQKKLGISEDEMEKRRFPTKRWYLKHYYGNAGYKNKALAHKGYVYIMLGEK